MQIHAVYHLISMAQYRITGQSILCCLQVRYKAFLLWPVALKKDLRLSMPSRITETTIIKILDQNVSHCTIYASSGPPYILLNSV